MRIPETVELDAVAAYEFSKAYRVQFNVNNLTDRLNYSQSSRQPRHALAGPHLHRRAGGCALNMMVRIPSLLSQEQVAHVRGVLAERTGWTARRRPAPSRPRPNTTSRSRKNAPAARALGEIILTALGQNERFTSAALAKRVFPPLFNRYDAGMNFGAHIDNSIRFVKGANIRVRTDISATLFLTEPQDYDGGELVIEDTYGTHSVKLPAGDLVVYSATSRHHVTPVTRGSRWASFFWIQSMIRDEAARAMLFELDTAIQGLRARLGEAGEVIALTGLYHNLVRRWADA